MSSLVVSSVNRGRQRPAGGQALLIGAGTRRSREVVLVVSSVSGGRSKPRGGGTLLIRRKNVLEQGGAVKEI